MAGVLAVQPRNCGIGEWEICGSKRVIESKGRFGRCGGGRGGGWIILGRGGGGSGIPVVDRRRKLWKTKMGSKEITEPVAGAYASASVLEKLENLFNFPYLLVLVGCL
jgi:hypothetical protein